MIFYFLDNQVSSRSQESSEAIPSADAQIGLLIRENQHDTRQTQPAARPDVLRPPSGSIPAKGIVQAADLNKHSFSGIDLNCVYTDLPERYENPEKGHSSVACVLGPEQHLLKLSPPQTSGYSDSNSGRSSSSGSETQV